jgi:hypothetical protein
MTVLFYITIGLIIAGLLLIALSFCILRDGALREEEQREIFNEYLRAKTKVYTSQI